MSENKDLLDLRNFEKMRRPTMEAELLPPWCYTSQDFYNREIEQIFMKTWNFVGRAELVPKPGDYITMRFAGVPIIVLRDLEGNVRAFSNSCRHRGSRLLSGEGNCNAIICPYHSWTYQLNGSLSGAAGMEKTIDFRREDHGLVPVRLENWEGFLFLNFQPNGESLEEHLGDFPDQLGSYKFSDMVCTRRKTYNLKCNWKLYIENQNEGYHVRTVHYNSLFGPRYGKAAPHTLTPVTRPKTRGNWMRIHLGLKGTEGIKRGETTTFPPIGGLEGLNAEGTNFVQLFPSTFFAFTTDCMWWMECRPHGPAETEVIVGSCFPSSTVARQDFAEQSQKYYARLDESHPEDNLACEYQQEGLSSPLSKLGRYSHMEEGVHTIALWVADRMMRPQKAQSA
jgi:phenylpropionate dioxygenase-like ring-hydroxylating dioxygenase large terminal subunit